jgi:hypothetical protein
MIGPAIFWGLLLTDNAWSRAFRPLLTGKDGAFPSLVFPLFLGVGLLLQLGTVLWQLFSQETLVVRSGSVEIKRQVAGLAFFLRQLEIRDLTLVEVREKPLATSRRFASAAVFSGFGGGTLLFATPNEQIAFGRDLDPAEARAALRELVALRALPATILSFT